MTTSRKDEFVVKFDAEGYKPMEIPVKTQIAGAGAAGFAGNIVWAASSVWAPTQ